MILIEYIAMELQAGCNERTDIYKMDAWGCSPLPHIIREDPDRWWHYVQLVPEEQYPDIFGILKHIQIFLAHHKHVE